MTLIKRIPTTESMERIKNEIVKFLEVRFSSNYNGEDADGAYKGVNFDWEWTSGELAEVYVPTPGLTLDEIWEVFEYIYHYGYYETNEKGEKVYEYKGILKDWNGLEIAKRNVMEREVYDADGTFKANNECKDAISVECQLELLQVVTEHMIPKRGEDEDYDAFYARCRRLTRAICVKYSHTDCTILGEGLWGIAEHYCDIVKDVKVISNRDGKKIIATEYYCNGK